MRVLVIGGTHHVGRALVETALRRGDTVSTLNRGLSRAPAPGVEALVADRTDPDAVRLALSDQTWDAVIDTWAWAPNVVRDTARLLADRAGHYGYVSSRGVYAWPWPTGADESAPLVAGDPGSRDNADYAAAKRGGELAVIESFGERALLARAGMILGPYEDVGRIPWWLRRLQHGGPVLAPGPADAAVQYIDAIDMASWMLTAAERGIGGAFNLAGPPGHTTIGALLETALEVTGSNAELVWAPAEVLEQENFLLGMEFGLRYPGDSHPTGLHDADVSAALAAGLTLRPLRETMADTWAWLQREGDPAPRPDAPSPAQWFDPDQERRVLDLVRARDHT
ncbi:NAD-dependent epimerase/dehydratase family protein [Nonomuraea sp. KC401]|uniref:NAD-dependent epimerase/dehydratase family protein n=1 Tax=unclassified Nonomuraea TaxID=2593643 RepID=UPI0010FEB1FF|nr:MULTISPECIES: NAD-dependent epimerase/dehydratase family protein [unclassified Nonomuraea]NBE93103.1 NAD-dependent epimerase/dehydratase family protein [Nonomuraea sp. K271]TLF80339.1 NAD-dependent epimerase/dehydratase family protein [Nonomuraea sp. KC401]